MYKHGHCKSGRETSEYKAWRHMKSRCLNPNYKYYSFYGGRGIKVCKRWHKFENFFKDMGIKPSPEFTLERRNNDGNYEPGNCKWATRKEQANNTRPKSCGSCEQKNFVAFGPNGEQIFSNNQSEFARKYGLDSGHISACILKKMGYKTHKGWKFEYLNHPRCGETHGRLP